MTIRHLCTLSEIEIAKLLTAKPDLEEGSVILAATKLGMAAFVGVGDAPSWHNSLCTSDHSYFFSPERLHVVLYGEHKETKDAICSRYGVVEVFARRSPTDPWQHVGKG